MFTRSCEAGAHGTVWGWETCEDHLTTIRRRNNVALGDVRYITTPTRVIAFEADLFLGYLVDGWKRGEAKWSPTRRLDDQSISFQSLEKWDKQRVNDVRLRKIWLESVRQTPSLDTNIPTFLGFFFVIQLDRNMNHSPLLLINDSLIKTLLQTSLTQGNLNCTSKTLHSYFTNENTEWYWRRRLWVRVLPSHVFFFANLISICPFSIFLTWAMHMNSHDNWSARVSFVMQELF